jgi:predicted phage baseplate assembly protein
LYAPQAFRKRLERAVTAEDYAAIVEREFPGKVQRAAAALRWNGSWNEVLVVVDARSREQADATLLDAVATRLERYRRIGHDVRVVSAQRVPLDIELRVCVLGGFVRAHVKKALLDVFGNRMYGDGQLGFFHPDRLSFGEGVFLSRLVAAAQAVAGVESVAVTRLQRLFEPADDEIASGVLPLGPLEIARLDNDPAVPDNGQLRLDMRGGR